MIQRAGKNKAVTFGLDRVHKELWIIINKVLSSTRKKAKCHEKLLG